MNMVFYYNLHFSFSTGIFISIYHIRTVKVSIPGNNLLTHTIFIFLKKLPSNPYQSQIFSYIINQLKYCTYELIARTCWDNNGRTNIFCFYLPL